MIPFPIFSSPESAYRPSGLKDTDSPKSKCPSKVRNTLPDDTSQSLIVLSSLPERAYLPSGLKLTDSTLPECPSCTKISGLSSADKGKGKKLHKIYKSGIIPKIFFEWNIILPMEWIAVMPCAIRAPQYEPFSPCPEFTLFPKKCQKQIRDVFPEFNATEREARKNHKFLDFSKRRNILLSESMGPNSDVKEYTSTAVN